MVCRAVCRRNCPDRTDREDECLGSRLQSVNSSLESILGPSLGQPSTHTTVRETRHADTCHTHIQDRLVIPPREDRIVSRVNNVRIAATGREVIRERPDRGRESREERWTREETRKDREARRRRRTEEKRSSRYWYTVDR